MSVAEAELLYEAPCERREGARGRTLRRAPHRGSLAPEGGARGGGERVGGRAQLRGSPPSDRLSEFLRRVGAATTALEH